MVTGDGAVAAAVRQLVPGARTPEVGLLGGDLHRTLGSPEHTREELYGGEGMRFPIDIVELNIVRPDGVTERLWFSAHLVAVEGGRALFAARTVVAMNAAFRGPHNLGPRAHPGDGLIDVTDGMLSFRERLQARSRLASGTHVPHPALRTRRVSSVEATFERTATVVLDDRDVGPARAIVLHCLPDAVVVVV